MTRSIDIMLSKPGVYVVDAGRERCLVEVDDAGRCYQLELATGTFARDGELRPGGWGVAAVTEIRGPLARGVDDIAAAAIAP